MAENSKIEWTDHSWSPWEGCEKVSAGCKFCYAEQRDKQYHGGAHWGADGVRKMMSESYWQKPFAWNRQSAAKGRRLRIFPSLCDPFEDRLDLTMPRKRMMELIEETPNLDWLLLTKRPRNVNGLVFDRWKKNGWPSNLWIGTSVENQETANERIPELMHIPAAVRFLSCEPLLGPVDLGFSVGWIDWVIVGGESGPGARPMEIGWLNSLRDQCIAAGVPVFIKQMGSEYAKRCHFGDSKGGDWNEWAAEYRIRQFPI